EDRAPSLHVWVGHIDLAIETSRPEQGLIQVLRAISGGYDHDTLAALKTIHRGQQRVDRLLVFAVRVKLAILPKPINFVDENDRWPALGCEPEKLTHALCPDSNKNLCEIAAMRTEKVRFSLAGDRFCQHRFACARRANE